MKTLFIVLFFISTINISFGQTDTIPKVNGEYEYQDIVILDSTYKKDDLYRNAKLYFVDNYKSAKDVIQYDDKEQGKIIGKGLFTLSDYQTIIFTPVSETRDVYYTTEITCKDGKYRYRLYGFYIKIAKDAGNNRKDYSTNTIDELYESTTKGVTKKMEVRLYNAMITKLQSSIETLKTYMIKKQSSYKDDF